jgi:polyhydroxybutyrate depolymerase
MAPRRGRLARCGRPFVVGLALASILASWLLSRDRDGRAAATAPFSYPAAPESGCSPKPPAASQQRTAGVAFTVRTPRNYDPRYRHSLLVVFAPAGTDAAASERLTGLTGVATAAGFIVAYVDHRPLSLAAIRDLGAVPDMIAESWCIDPDRIFLTGHSDGGTVATALALSPPPNRHYAGIAPSAAGFAARDLAAYPCPPPLAVFVAHGAADTLFPGFGRQAAKVWAACNRCDAAAPQAIGDGCVEFRGCARGARTVYCEHGGRHTHWPAQNRRLIEFFAARE